MTYDSMTLREAIEDHRFTGQSSVPRTNCNRIDSNRVTFEVAQVPSEL